LPCFTGGLAPTAGRGGGHYHGGRKIITTKIDHERHLILVRAEGPITLKDIVTHLEEEHFEGGLTYRELIDARGYFPDFSGADVRSIVALLRSLGNESRLGPTAIIVDTDVGYGMARMAEMLVEDVCAVRPFRKMEEAQEWLAAFPEGSA
jgi:hypothetical protein